jgi:hypothetical protein
MGGSTSAEGVYHLNPLSSGSSYSSSLSRIAGVREVIDLLVKEYLEAGLGLLRAKVFDGL